MIETDNVKPARLGFLFDAQNLPGRNHKADLASRAVIEQGPRIQNGARVAHQGTAYLSVGSSRLPLEACDNR
jgi:hypothetical protein